MKHLRSPSSDCSICIYGKSGWMLYAEKAMSALSINVNHSILNDKQPFITGKDGVYASKVAEAIYPSAESGRSVAVNYY